MPNKKYGKSSAEYYKENPESYAKKLKKQREINKKPEEIKKRAELVKENRKRGIYGNGDNLDVAHTKNGTKLQKASTNRGSTSAMPGDKRARGKKN
ncbi:MAG: hypothetical protein LBM02_09835 [Lachnospiraceae bacterium]|jgi:hypothetical protein|nr:hypothetical protein [Lachnospiraceae bacterium]